MSANGFQNRGFQKTFGQAGPYLSLGLEFAITLLLLIFLGRFLDKRWGTEPWLLLAGAILGFVIGFYHLIKTLSRLSVSKQKKGKTQR